MFGRCRLNRRLKLPLLLLRSPGVIVSVIILPLIIMVPFAEYSSTYFCRHFNVRSMDQYLSLQILSVHSFHHGSRVSSSSLEQAE